MPTLKDRQLESAGRWTENIGPHPGRRMSEEEFVAWYDDKTRAEWSRNWA